METIYIYGAGKKGKRLARQLEYYMKKSESRKKNIIFVDRDFLSLNELCNMKYPVVSLDYVIDNFTEGDIIFCTIPEFTEELYKIGLKTVYGGVSFLQYLIPDIETDDTYSSITPFNHYESPYSSSQEIQSYISGEFEKRIIREIDFNTLNQAKLLKCFSKIDAPIWNWGLYNDSNGWFDKPSADSLYYLMRFLKPKNIIEIGSGYSTAAMMDVNNKFFDESIKITCIEPFPQRLFEVVGKDALMEHIEERVQDVPLQIFKTLNKNDILFIDSSHIARHGSDVNFELFEILPILNEGVYIHFHDVFYPFVYPRRWVVSGRAYNEMYLIRAFLMNNSNYEVVLLNGCGRIFDETDISFPEEFRYLGEGSLWIRKK